MIPPISGNLSGVLSGFLRAAPPPDGETSFGFLVMLVLIGLALVVAEVFFVSFGVLAILSGVSLVSAVFFAFTNSTAMGIGFLVVCAIGVPLTVKYAFVLMPHTRIGRQFYLPGNKHEDVQGAAQQQNLGDFLGKVGVAVCDLRPSGFAQIGGHRVDVITRGEMLDTGSPLKVIKVELNQIIVALDESASN